MLATLAIAAYGRLRSLAAIDTYDEIDVYAAIAAIAKGADLP